MYVVCSSYVKLVPPVLGIQGMTYSNFPSLKEILLLGKDLFDHSVHRNQSDLFLSIHLILFYLLIVFVISSTLEFMLP